MSSNDQNEQSTNADIAIGGPTEFIVLACKSNALRCRVPGTASELTLRTAVRDEVPGDIDDRAQAIIAHGKRRSFEMEQVIPGADPEDFDSDPIIEAAERSDIGDHAGARAILMDLLAQDLRCLDAHAHLGNHEFRYRPEQALRHCETGTAIGEFSLGPRFRDALPWGLIDNRPHLRCLHGKGLALWRIGRMQDAAAIFQRLLWLNPSDNQGARFCLAAVEAGKAWEP